MEENKLGVTEAYHDIHDAEAFRLGGLFENQGVSIVFIAAFASHFRHGKVVV